MTAVVELVCSTTEMRDTRERLAITAFGALIGVLLTAPLVPGCGTSCSSADSSAGSPPTVFKEGTTNADRTFYSTSEWEGPLLHFPPERRYHLFHGLKARPDPINAYLAFSARPLDDDGNLSEAAGNQVVIEEITDEYIQLRNDTCAEFYLRVTASAPSSP